jgi:hypothetical protein
MKSQWILIGALVVGLLLGAAVGLSLAQPPEPGEKIQPQEEIFVAAAVSSKISYQGVLKESGQPVTGDRQIVFRLYSDGACASQVGNPVTYTVPITNGLFSVELDVTPSDFDGRGLWLETEVSGTSVACQEMLPVPYALSLRPGAIISGTAYQNFRVNSYAPSGGIPAAIVGVVEAATDGVGVFARNYTSSPGAAGMGVWGISDSPAGRGVFGQATNTGVGVAAYSAYGDPIEAYGGLPASEVFRVDNTGNVTQTRTADGLVKAGAYVSCIGSTSSIMRSFNNVGGAVTLVANSDPSECTIDFGFQINDRYWTVTTDQDVYGAFPNACTASCVPVGAGTQLECTRWNDRLSSFQGGNVMVLIY